VLSRWGYFVAWAVAGAGVTLAFLAALSIGPYVLVLAAVWTGALLTRRSARGPAAFGAIAGAAAPAFWLAWTNRAGPGDVCTTTRSGSMCAEEWSPWPFGIVGAVLLATGVALYVWQLRGTRRASAASGLNTNA
jgi:hypothetical protein